MLRKALRLDPKAEGVKKLEAEIAYLEGVLLIEQGSADRFLLNRALELDPGHDRARRALASLEVKVVERKSNLHRYAAAGGIGLAALIGMIALAKWPRRPGPKPSDKPPGGGSSRAEDAVSGSTLNDASADGGAASPGAGTGGAPEAESAKA
jgi:hypothetical protein